MYENLPGSWVIQRSRDLGHFLGGRGLKAIQRNIDVPHTQTLNQFGFVAGSAARTSQIHPGVNASLCQFAKTFVRRLCAAAKVAQRQDLSSADSGMRISRNRNGRGIVHQIVS